MKITRRTFSFVSGYDGVPIHGICYVPEQPVAIIQMVHGMCEHKERFESFMEKMAQNGYVALMHDNRGHGQSVKQAEEIGYCYEAGAEGYVEDIYAVTRKIRKEFPGLPLVLYGHSMGSLGVRAYLQWHDRAVDGLIVSGCPSYNDGVPFGKMLVCMLAAVKGWKYRSKWMQNLVLGSFEWRFRAEKRKNAWLAAKPEVAEEYGRDPLNTFTYTLNGMKTLLDLEWITYKAGRYACQNPDLPVLFLSGYDDPCYISERKWEQAVERLRKLGYSDIVEIRYPGMRHEIHNEEENDRVFADIASFVSMICGKTI